MDELETKKAILSRLYEAYFSSNGRVDLTSIREQTGYEEGGFRKLLDRMGYDGLIRALGVGKTHKITHMGIDAVESQNIGLHELVRKNQGVRLQILKFLKDVFDAEGPEEYVHFQELASKLALDSNLVWANLELMSFGAGVEDAGIDRIWFRISHFGLRKLESYGVLVDIVTDFERIAEMIPQPRGRALQKLLAKVFAYQGWPQLEGLRTSNEEMDVIVYRGREYYFIECKWEAAPIQTEVVDKLHGKLSRRPDVRGIIASMSGFTKGAVDAAKSHANTRVILFFGPEDLRSMIYGLASFEELLDQKYQEFVTRQMVVYY